MMDDKNNIPNGWSNSSFGDVAHYFNGRCFKSSEWEKSGLPIIRIQNLNKLSALFNYTNKSFDDQYRVENDELLFSWSASLDVYFWKRGSAWLNQHIFKVIPKNGIEKKYLFYGLSNHLSDLKAQTHGAGMVHITKKKFEKTSILIPPLNEQKRIVAKIEELFYELDKGVESLKTARAKLKVYRQAVLKHAFEGKLTSKWREQNKDKLEPADKLLERIKSERETHYKQQLEDWQSSVKTWEENGKEGKKPTKPRQQKIEKPSPEQYQKMWKEPYSWQWIQVGDFAFVTKLAGFEYTDYVKYDEEGDLPVIKAENAGLNGFKPTDYSRVHSVDVANLKRSYLLGGEILVVFVGAGTGNVAVVPKDQQFFLGPNIGMVRPESNAINSRYIELFLRSPMGKDMILASVKAVAQPSISMGVIRQTPIILPSLLEQEEIVKQLDETLSSIDRVENEIKNNLKKSEALRQSILKKAFSGKLVAQDPNDEPASVLLQRIRAEKEAQQPKPKKTKAKRKAA